MTTDSVARLSAALADRYRIERELGQGGMATVYLAEDLKHKRKVALKVLRPELAAVLGGDRFVQEITTTAALQHPHILPLFDSGTADSFLYYVMPYVEGETLRDKLNRETQLGVAEAVRIASEVADALDYAHRHGVIHRDIKPENILLHDGRPMVADFGIALALSAAAGGRMTETGMSLGTPHYMSPEQATAEKEITARSDVYSLGSVLYEMLAGQPPHLGGSAQQIIMKIIAEPVADVTTLRKSVPPNVAAAVAKSLEKLPADRFESAASFAEALGNPAFTTVTARREDLAARPVPRWTLAAAVLAGVVVGGLGVRALAGGGETAAVAWRGELLGGPRVAFTPHISPDGELVAFAAMVDGQTQLAVLKPQSGDWTLLTSDRARGQIENISWSSDNSRIYFSRYFQIPNGVYSVSPLGTGERLVLEDAANPAVLPDGSLLVERVNADRDLQMYRYWPASGRLDTLPATRRLGSGSATFFRAFPDGREAAFFGRPAGARDSAQHLYAIDLTTRAIRRLALDIDIGNVDLAVTPDGRSVVVPVSIGNTSRLIAILRDGSRDTKVLVLLTGIGWGFDLGRDGSLYLDQGLRPSELRRYDPATRRTEAWPIPAAGYTNANSLLPLPDGRVLLVVPTSNGSRVLTMVPGGPSQPFMASEQQTNGPFALLGHDRVALVLGTGADALVAIASIATGQVTARLPGLRPTQMAGSPDGTTLYYVQENVVWAIPSAGGAARKVHDGDAVAVDPHGRYLVIELVNKSGVHLVHVPLDGGAEEEIIVRSEMRPAPAGYLAPNAIHPDGRIALAVLSPASWFWPMAILDPRTGRIEVIPPGLVEDTYGGWDGEGRVVYATQGVESSLWRFRPISARDGAP